MLGLVGSGYTASEIETESGSGSATYHAHSEARSMSAVVSEPSRQGTWDCGTRGKGCIVRGEHK